MVADNAGGEVAGVPAKTGSATRRLDFPPRLRLAPADRLYPQSGGFLLRSDLRFLQFLRKLLKSALLLFKHVAIGMIVGLMDLMRQIREASFQDLDEDGSFVVVEGQGVHISFPHQGTEAAVVTATPTLDRSVFSG